jgi:hypothetical protein
VIGKQLVALSQAPNWMAIDPSALFFAVMLFSV